MALIQPFMRMPIQGLASGNGKMGSNMHPDYLNSLSAWEKYRYTMIGGEDFVNKYLEMYSDRESSPDFAQRKKLSPCAAIAKSNLLEVKNSIYSRMRDITRVEGSEDYQTAVNGLGTGVDRDGRSMDSFIGDCVIEELLAMGKVGVYVDKERVETNSMAEHRGKVPYLYVYNAEQIVNWRYKTGSDELAGVILKDYYYENDEFGFPSEQKSRYRVVELVPGAGVQVKFYDNDGVQQGRTVLLPLTRLPFVIFELSDSLLKDIADYQIALTNIESSDINYAVQSNFPFYTEQGKGSPSDYMRPASRDDSTSGDAGNATQGATAKEREVKTSPKKGRRYQIGAERPGFIHPSPEPLRVSMEKQDQIKATVKQLLHLSISNLRPTRQAEDSKKIDQQGLESGLASVGSVLEYGENEIAKIWAAYEGSDEVATVHYPEDYSLKSDEERVDEANDKVKLMDKIPSLTYQREMAKQITNDMLRGKVSAETLNAMFQEIDNAEVIVIDSEIIERDVELGLLTRETASTIRLYPEDEAKKAESEHARRLKRLAISQTEGAAKAAAASKVQGVPDLNDDNLASTKSGEKE